ALLDLHGVLVRLGHGDLGVGHLAELAVQQLAIFQDPVVLDLALRSTSDDVLHAGGGARPLRLRLRHLAGLVEPFLRQPLSHQLEISLRGRLKRTALYLLTRSVTPAKRSSSGTLVATALRASTYSSKGYTD